MKAVIVDKESIEYLVNRLDSFDRDEAIRYGLMAAGKVFQSGGENRLKERMKSGSQGVSGGLLRSFKTRLKKRKPGVLIGFNQDGKGETHAHLVDRGTKERFNKAGASRGIMPANRFWEDTRSQDEKKAMNELYQGVQRAVNRIKSRS
jgi:hypothetical protein